MIKYILSSLALASSLTATAASNNDFYGTVNQLIVRADGNNSMIYFRMAVDEKSSNVASCVSSANGVAWYLDVDSSVSQQQYQLLLDAYKSKQIIRVIGQSNPCSSNRPNSDTVFEMSPWSWKVTTN